MVYKLLTCSEECSKTHKVLGGKLMKRLQKSVWLVTIFAAFVGWFQSGCTRNLKPAPEAHRVAGMKHAAEMTVQGVYMVAQSQPWPGRWRIEQHVTPLRVVIENNSRQPLCLRYEDFSLVGDEGNRFAALPLNAIEGVTVESIETPRFRHRHFYVAPYYSDVYPDITPYPHRFPYDPFYYERYRTYWSGISLPTPFMREKALPEGVIETEGRVEGWLYFERMKHVTRVSLRMDLVNAETGEEFGEIRIPYVKE